MTSTVKTKIVEMLQKHNVFWYEPRQSGVPDFICCFKSKFVAIEAKAAGGKTTPLQDKAINEIRLHGGHAMVVNENNLDTLEFLINTLEK